MEEKSTPSLSQFLKKMEELSTVILNSIYYQNKVSLKDRLKKSMFNPWILLFVGIGFEVVATTCLKLSQGFTKLWPSIGFVIFFAAAFYLFSLCINHIEIGIAYAVWAGLGIGLIAIVGVLFFSEEINFLKFLAIGMIIMGAIILNMTNTG